MWDLREHRQNVRENSVMDSKKEKQNNSRAKFLNSCKGSE